jgi:hypothetical protein
VDAFEQLASDIFWNEGYWVRTGFKVELTREEKIRIGRHSAPRWEIDLVAYSPTSNEVLALECKSYLDSGGVHAAHFVEGSRYAKRYKLFHDATLRETVLERLRLQMVQCGLCPASARIRLGLVHAHATSRNAALLCDIFDAQEWLLFGPEWIRNRLERMSRGSYENNTAAVVAKLLLRTAPRASTDLSV